MSSPPLVIALCGSLRRYSWNRRVLELLADRSRGRLLIEPAFLHDLPLFDQDLEDAGRPVAVDHLSRRVAVAPGRGLPERAGTQAYEALDLCLADLVAPPAAIAASSVENRRIEKGPST